MAKKKRKYVRKAKPEVTLTGGVAYGTKNISPLDVSSIAEYKKQSHEELYFPIAVRMVDTQEIKIIKGIYALPRGRAFVILTTNED